MSHFTKVKTKLVDAETVKKALAELGYKVLDGKSVAGWSGKKVNSEFKIKPSKSHYEIGFVKNSGSYEMVADWSMMGLNQEAFVSKLSQSYGRVATIEKLTAQGYQLIEEKVEKTGEIRLMMRRS